MQSTMSLTSMEVSTPVGQQLGFVYIRKSRVYLLLLAALIILVLVSVLTGVLAAKHEQEVAKVKYSKLAGKLNQVATEAPSKPPTMKITTRKPIETTTVKPEIWDKVRLPDNIIPYHYDLSIQPFIKNLTFRGDQKAYIEITSPTRYILIHIKKMNITRVGLERRVAGKTESVPIEKGFEKPNNEYFVIQTKNLILVGKYLLKLEYEAHVSEQLTGFYRSTYTAADGKTRTLLTTKFQPTDARKAFPCFDEPALKATFTITMMHEKGYIALSNMPGKTVDVDSNWRKTTFGKTVRMSAYLVCFIVCDFEKRSMITGKYNNITLGVWSSPPQINSTKFGLEVGHNMTTFFEDFFKVLYPLPKLDMVAIPDYGSGATEHWGLITYRQARLLITDGVSSGSNRQSSAAIIAHELAHLWFGNLVTCKWWNDLWVQEGMASYIEYYGQHHVNPDWKMWDQFVGSDWKRGMDLDALASSHPIILPVTHPKQIKAIFDSITYNKGSSIIRMLDDYLGEDTFRNGLAKYLTTHKFNVSTSDDLWAAFSQVSGKNIKAMMDTWTLQMGYPVVTITRKSDTEALVKQKHFLLDPKAKVKQTSRYNYTWEVPFSYVTMNKPKDKQSAPIKKTLETISILWPKDTWIKGNYMTKGFYRVNYDKSNWKMIIMQLKKDHNVFSASDRAGIIDDAFAFARANLLSYDIALSTTSYLEKEESYVVWKLALRNLGYLNKVLKARKSYGKFRAYMLKILRPMVKKLGWAMTGTHIDKFKRSLFLWSACEYGDQDSLNTASTKFQEWAKNNKTKLDSNLQSLVFYYGVANGGAKEWEIVFDRYLTEQDPTTKGKLQGALSGSQLPWILNKWLVFSIDKTVVRSQDTVYVISDVASNPVGKYVAWDFSRANWDTLMKIASANNFHVTKLTLGITASFTTEFELEQMKDFWKKKPNAGAGALARIQAAERIQASIDWVKQYASTVETWLNTESI